MPDRLPKANTQFDKLTLPQLANYGQAIVTGLSTVEGTALYPTPPVTIVQIQAAVDGLNDAIAAAENGGVQETANKAVAAQNLRTALRSVAQYVTTIAQSVYSTYDDIRLRISYSGYVASAIPTPLSSLPQLTVELCQSMAIGQLNVRLTALPGAKAYIARYKRSTDTQWQTFVSSSSRFIIPNLQSAAIYNVIFVPKGTRNTTVTETDQLNPVIL